MGTRIVTSLQSPGREARVGLCAARWAALRQPARGSSVPAASTELHVTSHVSTPRDHRNNPREQEPSRWTLTQLTPQRN